MKFLGKAWKFGDDIDTDVIIPARYLNITDPLLLAQHCMEPLRPKFFREVSKGDIIVAGRNFGCGSSREHAPIAIKAVGITCIIASSFARIFYRNAFNIGLVLLESPEAVSHVEEGDILSIDVKNGIIENVTKNLTFKVKPLPTFMLDLIEEGGLVSYIAKKLKCKKGITAI